VVWCRSITKENLFEPVFSVFLENGPRYNMLNSSETLKSTLSFSATQASKVANTSETTVHKSDTCAIA